MSVLDRALAAYDNAVINAKKREKQLLEELQQKMVDLLKTNNNLQKELQEKIELKAQLAAANATIERLSAPARVLRKTAVCLFIVGIMGLIASLFFPLDEQSITLTLKIVGSFFFCGLLGGVLLGVTEP